MGGRSKRREGRYYTRGNPFVLPAFKRWADRRSIKRGTILEPFAGDNSLVRMLVETGLCTRSASFDIRPAGTGVRRRDTIAGFPSGFATCVSNPPWLGKYSARRRGLPWPRIAYDDLYKHCLDLALGSCRNVAYIMPATFLHWWGGLSRSAQLDPEKAARLEAVIFLNTKMFRDTENPVCLALFGPDPSRHVSIYYDRRLAGRYADLGRHLPSCAGQPTFRFNAPRGRLGLVCIDDTTGPTIRFCRGSDLPHKIKHSSRSITRINLDIDDAGIATLNRRFGEFRRRTHDVFLTPFKGLRRDGMYRRRLDYVLARRFICQNTT